MQYASPMRYTSHYMSPLGDILLVADESALVGVRVDEDWLREEVGSQTERETPVLTLAKSWLDVYFSGRDPGEIPPVRIDGTPFQMEVCEIVRSIPYGRTTTYGDIATEIAGKRGIRRMAAQAVGGAVGRCPISIFVPCHRVVGAGGNLTGYGGRIDLKIKLLKLEGVDMSAFYVPGRRGPL
jgi:methylated-DNA-[protein]-cysteine S-methyltransferase